MRNFIKFKGKLINLDRVDNIEAGTTNISGNDVPVITFSRVFERMLRNGDVNRGFIIVQRFQFKDKEELKVAYKALCSLAQPVRLDVEMKQNSGQD